MNGRAADPIAIDEAAMMAAVDSFHDGPYRTCRIRSAPPGPFPRPSNDRRPGPVVRHRIPTRRGAQLRKVI